MFSQSYTLKNYNHADPENKVFTTKKFDNSNTSSIENEMRSNMPRQKHSKLSNLVKPGKQRKVLGDVQPINVVAKHHGKPERKSGVLYSKIFRCSKQPTPCAYPSNRRRKAKPDKQQNGGLDVPVPEKIQPNDEPMDVEIPKYMIRSLYTKCPIGVLDIDAKNIDDTFQCPEYAQDIIDYIQAREAARTYPANFMAKSPELSGEMRAILMDWLIMVQHHEELSEDTLHIAVAMIDRVISIQKIKLSQLQLIGITCLLVAAKFVERFPPAVDTLCHLTEDSYNKDQTLCMERVVLDLLSFDINIPTSFQFLDRFLQVEEIPQEVNYACRYFLDMSLTGEQFVAFAPSMMAASALYLARRLLLNMDSTTAWSPGLSYYSKYSLSQLKPCVRALCKTLKDAPDAKVQGARNKYASVSHYGGISKHRALEFHPALRELSMSETTV